MAEPVPSEGADGSLRPGWTPTRVATEADLPAIGEALAGAFEHDPIWGWAFEDAERERKLAALGAVFGFCAAAALEQGWVRVTEEVEAVALWIPPGAPEMSPADAERFPAVVAEACSEAAAARVLELMAAFDRNHPHEPTHFYLSLLGTHPDHAGQGLGMALVAANLEEIDGEGAPAYLESSNPANVPRYERLGFESGAPRPSSSPASPPPRCGAAAPARPPNRPARGRAGPVRARVPGRRGRRAARSGRGRRRLRRRGCSRRRSRRPARPRPR